MKFLLAILPLLTRVLAGCGDGGRDAPPANIQYTCAIDAGKSPKTIDVQNKYIPYFQGLTGTQCGTNGGCCTDMYKNAKMCGKLGGEDCGAVADALRVLVDECSATVGGVEYSGGNYVSCFLAFVLMFCVP
jgi:hypothetical protein